MAYSFGDQFATIVQSLRPTHHAHLCDGDPNSAVAWNDATEITARLSLRDDEIWILAGAGLLARFIAPSDGEFDPDTITSVVDEILRGGAVELFTATDPAADAPRTVTGFVLDSGSVASGSSTQEATFAGRLGGPFARANITEAE